MVIRPDNLEAWKQALDLQKHFNDILFRIRGLAFAFGGAATAVLVTRAAGAPSVIANPRWLGFAAPWLALYVVDRLYYHELLRAAVHFAEELERAGEAPPLCTALTRENRRTGFGRWKVSLFYWLPLAGLSYAVAGGAALWALSILPFLVLEIFAFAAHRIHRT